MRETRTELLKQRLAVYKMNNDAEEHVTIDLLTDFTEVLDSFEASAVRADWDHQSNGVSTLAKVAEDVKAASRQLRKSLVEAHKVSN